MKGVARLAIAINLIFCALKWFPPPFLKRDEEHKNGARYMAEFAALPIFTDSLIADTTHLDHEEFGIYMRLLFLAWRTPDCCLPNDEKWIERKLNRTPYEDIKPILEEFFTINKKGVWNQKRLTKEYSYVKKKRISNKKAAKKRWNSRPKPQDIENKEKEGMQTQSKCNAPSPSPSPSPSLNNGNNIYGVEIKKPEYSQNFLDIWEVWPRRRRGDKKQAYSAYKTALTKDTEENINHGVQKYIDSSEARDYPKGCAAWFRASKWTDDYTDTKPVPKNGGRLSQSQIINAAMQACEKVH